MVYGFIECNRTSCLGSVYPEASCIWDKPKGYYRKGKRGAVGRAEGEHYMEAEGSTIETADGKHYWKGRGGAL